MLRIITLIFSVAGIASVAHAANSADPIVSVIKESTQDNSRLAACLLLAQASNKSNAGPATKKKAINLVTQRLTNREVSMVRARADVARKGLYGYGVDESLAFRLYSKATKSVEAGWNGALMIYGRNPNGLSQSDAQLIMSLLHKSGAAMPNSRGVVGSYAHYLAGLLSEAGTATGKPDLKKAFIHYRTSARNSYVPGAFHYMRLLAQTMAKLPEADRSIVIQEMRMMLNRWKWQSAEIMFLAGDVYASKWLPDENGFMAQYHWRMAKKMGGAREISDFDGAIRSRIRPMTAEMEKRLDDAVEAGSKNLMTVKHELEFVDLCAE